MFPALVGVLSHKPTTTDPVTPVPTVPMLEGVYVGSLYTSDPTTLQQRSDAWDAHALMAGRQPDYLVEYAPSETNTVYAANLWSASVANFLAARPGLGAELTYQLIINVSNKGGAVIWTSGMAYTSGLKVINETTAHLYTVVGAGTSGASFTLSGSGWTLTDEGLASDFHATYFNYDLRQAASIGVALGSGLSDARYTAAAQRMVSQGLAGVDIRLAHESYGDWERWHIGSNTRLGNPDAGNADGGQLQWYMAARRFHDLFRAEGFYGEFILNVETDVRATGNKSSVYGIAALDAQWVIDHPADERVFTVLSTDTYDEGYPQYQDTAYYGSGVTQALRLPVQKDVWANNILPGLEKAAAWCRAHAMTFRLSEWGVWTKGDHGGGLDDPYYVQKLIAWMAANTDITTHAAYFDFADGGNADHRLYHLTNPVDSPTKYPLAAAAYAAGVANWVPLTTTPGTITALIGATI